MTVAFYKLQVAGDDFVLVDRSSPGHDRLLEDPTLLPGLARSILDRRRGVGGRALIAVGGPATGGPAAAGSATGSLAWVTSPSGVTGTKYRVYEADGQEIFANNDARLCVARWVFDSGRAAEGQVVLAEGWDNIVLKALDSRSFGLYLAPPRRYDGTAVLTAADGRLAQTVIKAEQDLFTVYLIHLERLYAIVFPQDTKLPLAPIREAIKGAYPDASFIAVKMAGRDLVGFVAAASSDRLTTAAAGLVAAVLAKRSENAAVAEWRGRGAAVAYAFFEKASSQLTAPLVDRGRFWIDWLPDGRLQAAGIAEYVFEGRYDYLEL